VIHTITIPYIRFPSLPSAAFPLRTYVDRPALETKIEYQGSISTSFYSIIDSGADSCVFASIWGKQIGINIGTGKAELTLGAAGSGASYYHSIRVHVQLQSNWIPFNCFGGFLDGLDQFGFGLLGHHGFFSLFESVTLDSKSGIVELAYDVP